MRSATFESDTVADFPSRRGVKSFRALDFGALAGCKPAIGQANACATMRVASHNSEDFDGEAARVLHGSDMPIAANQLLMAAL